MRHIDFVLTIITLFSGFASLSLLFFLFWKYRLPQIPYAILFFSPFHAGFILYLIQLYLTAISPQYSIYAASQIWNGLVIAFGFYCIPFSISRILEKPFPLWEHGLFLFFGLLRIVLAVILSFGRSSRLLYPGNCIEIGLAIYLFIVLQRNTQKIKIRELARFFGEFRILLIITIPLVVLTNLFYHYLISLLPFISVFTPLREFYFVSNLLIIKAIFLYFSRESSPADPVSKAFLDFFAISSREAEIISLLIEGCTAKEIAGKLFITRQTVKNHIYRIYKKTGVRNKVELVQLVSRG